MRRPMVAGNWKLNGTLASIDALLGGLLAGAGGVASSEMVVCPPFVYIPAVCEKLKGSPIGVGGQDLSDQVSGAFTGEVSGDSLKELGCGYVIVGHSERRSLFDESDQFTAQKFVAAQNAGLIPILCVGELLEEREQGITEEVVARQLDAVLDLAGVASLSNAVVAYEPVWAIGTGKTASPEQAQEVHQFIRQKIATLDATIAAAVRILYGGSVKGSNAAELFGKDDIDGGLIGGASLQVEDFLAICNAPD